MFYPPASGLLPHATQMLGVALCFCSSVWSKGTAAGPAHRHQRGTLALALVASGFASVRGTARLGRIVQLHLYVGQGGTRHDRASLSSRACVVLTKERVVMRLAVVVHAHLQARGLGGNGMLGDPRGARHSGQVRGRHGSRRADAHTPRGSCLGGERESIGWPCH